MILRNQLGVYYGSRESGASWRLTVRYSATHCLLKPTSRLAEGSHGPNSVKRNKEQGVVLLLQTRRDSTRFDETTTWMLGVIYHLSYGNTYLSFFADYISYKLRIDLGKEK